MPIMGISNNNSVMGNSYRKDPLHAYAKAFSEAADIVLKESGYDIFEEPQKVLRRGSSKEAMKKFFVENSYDPNNTTLDSADMDDITEMAETQFENDVKAMYEHSAPADYSPMIGLALPIHKLILMNNVFDKGGIQKVTAVSPKFPISLERRILVKPDGTEIDMFLEQNKITDAIRETNPEKIIELDLPVTEEKDIIVDYFGGTSLDNLDISTRIYAVQVEGVQIDVGDIVPDENGYINKNGEVATEQITDATVWYKTDIRFTPNYGGPNHFERAVTTPLSITYKDGTQGGVVTTIRPIITGSMNKNRFNIADLAGKITKIRLAAKLDASSRAFEQVSVKWKVDTDLVEIPTAPGINTTISPEEVKDIAALYNVNQLTKIMSIYKDVLSEKRDRDIKDFLDDSYSRLDERCGLYDEFDFAPPAEYALTAVEYRQKMFMDFLDDLATRMFQVLNDPNMTVTIFGDPRIVRKLTPKDYAYTAPATIGPVTLDYTQTICNLSDKRVYNFVGSDKLRNTNELMILINPHNNDRIVYRIYDYQLYVSNEIRNIANPSLPSVQAFDRFLPVEYMPIQSRCKILNPSGLRSE